MTSLPINLNIAPTAPVQSAAQNSSSSSQADASQNSFDAHMQDSANNTQAPQSRTNQNRTTTETTTNTGNRDTTGGKFSKLMSDKQAPSAPASSTTVKVTVSGSTDTAATDDTDNSTAAVVAVISQLQVKVVPITDLMKQIAADITTQNAGATNADSKDSTSSAPAASLDDLLKQLTELLQQALQQQPTASTATASTDATTATTDTAASTDDTKNTDDAQSGLAALIQALLQQMGNTTAPTTTASTDSSATAAISDSTSSAPSSTLANALSKLADLLEQKTGADAKDTAAQPTADTQANAPVKGDSKLFKAISDALTTDSTDTKQPQDTASLQQTVAKVIDALTAPKDSDAPKQDIKTDLSASAATPQAAPAAPTVQAPQTADFAKDLQQAAPQTPQDQVLVHIKNAISDGTSQIRIQLHPEDMGKVDVQMNTDTTGKTSVTITSDNRQTLAMLQSDARALQDALRDIGLKTDAGGLNFNLRDSGQDARNSSKQQQGGYTKVAGVADVTEDTGFSTTGSLYRMSVQQGLDIRV